MYERDRASSSLAVPSFLRGLPTTRAAFRYASRVDEGRRRDSDQAAFVLHPLEVAAMLHFSGAPDEVVAAGMLHDVAEHGGSPLGEIHRRFGGGVSALVAAVTEDTAVAGYGPRKAALRAQVSAAGAEAGEIFAADKLARTRELRVRIGQARLAGVEDPADGEAKLEHYRASLAMLEDLIPGSRLVTELRFEVEALGTLPPDDQLAPAAAVGRGRRTVALRGTA